MNREELVKTLESLGVRPGRGLGQNFLLDNNLLDYIVRKADIKPGERIFEVGPGLGALTWRLLKTDAVLTSIEFDSRFCKYWRQEIAAGGNAAKLDLIEGDACRVNWQELTGDAPYRIVANLPYAASSVLIGNWLDLPNPPAGMVLMLQKEMAQRLASGVGTKNYGALTVRTQLLYEVKLERIVPPEVFLPPPEVDSAIVSFSLRPSLPDMQLRKTAGNLAKAAFAQRRKQMPNTLSNAFGSREKVREVLVAIGHPESERPERLTPDEWLQLAAARNNIQ